ncbi:MAG: stress response translation initiation inhibitor YciH [Candidatus Terraquivivens tikiterensis]|uniref:Protein translation factor SUI1 homolog n=1 Tax=Candidatus Terraquivivens tikiterensis TaxID=1980982 RepID=A0A2R7Y859_9ARCH|nr:MAG: stress response translation initiation inhibitor YciH [Candidatus Terraquivivens tikiterensis]
MPDICPRCGLPTSICACETISREQQHVRVKLELRKWGKVSTIIEGLDGSKRDLAEIASKLKSACACGGGLKDGVIILQGDHREKVRELLISMGLQPENIDVI